MKKLATLTTKAKTISDLLRSEGFKPDVIKAIGSGYEGALWHAPVLKFYKEFHGSDLLAKVGMVFDGQYKSWDPKLEYNEVFSIWIKTLAKWLEINSDRGVFKDFTKVDFYGYASAMRFDNEFENSDLPLIGQFEVEDWFGQSNIKMVDVLIDKECIQVIPLEESTNGICANLDHDFNKKLAGRLADVIFGSAPVTSDELLSLGFHTM